MQFQYPALVEPLIAITDYKNPEVFYPDLLDVRAVPVESYFVEPILPIIPTFFADITEDYYVPRSEDVYSYYVEPLFPLAPVVFDPSLFPRVGYPDFLARGRDDSYFPFIGDTRGPVIPAGVANKHSLIEFYNLRIRLDVKKAVDSGVIDVDTITNPTGVTVNFNKAFKDIDSIVATVQETTAFVPVVNFVDIPNPVSFKLYVFDSTTGAAGHKVVYWVARGII